MKLESTELIHLCDRAFYGQDGANEARVKVRHIVASHAELLAQLQEMVFRFGHNDSPEDLAALDEARAAITNARA